MNRLQARYQQRSSYLLFLPLMLLVMALEPQVAAAESSEGLLRSPKITRVPAGPRAAENADALQAPIARGTDADSSERQTGSETWFGGIVPTIAGALAISLGLFCLWVALMRRGSMRLIPRQLPREAVEVMGQTMLGPKEKLMIVRCGMQALILGVTPAGMHRLAQIDDPDEAGQLLAACRSSSAAKNFQSTLRELEREPVGNSFLETPAERNSSRPLSQSRRPTNPSAAAGRSEGGPRSDGGGPADSSRDSSAGRLFLRA